MKYIISNTAAYINTQVASQHNETFKEFTQRISKPELISNDFNKVTRKIIIPATMITADQNYDRLEAKVEDGKTFQVAYKDDVAVAEFWESGALRKSAINFKDVTMMALDFDGIESPDTLNEVQRLLTNENINHVIYQSPSYGTKKTDKLVYNFRVFIEIDMAIPKHMWKYVSSQLMIELEQIIWDTDVSVLEVRHWMKDKTIRKFDDISTTQPTRHQMYPYARDLNNFIFNSFTDGKPLDTYQARITAMSMLEDDKTEEERRADRRAKLIAHPETTGGEIDPGRNILGQISWVDFNLDLFIHTAGLDLTFDGVDKYIGRCPNEAEHNSPSGPKDFHIRNTGEIPVVSCSHASCSLNGAGATTQLFTDECYSIDTSCIKHYEKTPMIEWEPLVSTQLETDTEYNKEIKKDYGNIEDAFKNDSKDLLILGKTGVGKSTIIAKKTAATSEKVLILCSTISEIQQMADTIIKGGVNPKEIHCLTSDHNVIPDDIRVVITHYYYTLRRGHSTELYKLIEWAEEVNPILFCDEIDSYTQIAFSEIELSARYVKHPEHDQYIKVDSCRSNATNRMQCDKCIKHDRVWREFQAGQPVFKFLPRAKSFLFQDSDRTNLDSLSSVNNVISHQIVKSTKLHTLTYSKLEWTVGDLDNPFELDNENHYYVDDIIASSLYSFKVSTNEDLRESKMNKFRLLCDKFKRSNKDEYSEEKMNTWVNQEMNKEGFPYHTCGTEKLCYLDTKGMQKIINAASQRYFLTGTMSQYQLKTLNALCGGNLSQYEVKAPLTDEGKPVFQPIKNVLVITTTGDVKWCNNYETLTDGVPIELDGDTKIHKTFAVVDTKSTITKLKNSEAVKTMGFFDPETKGVTVTENLRNGQWDVLSTHKRSSLTRGINLGEFSTIFYDYQANKSMNAYDFGETLNLVEARTIEHTTLTLQGTGRINRKPIINGELSDNAPNKVIIVYNAYESDIDNQPVDVTGRLNEMFEDNYNETCDNVTTVNLDRYYDECDLVNILKHAYVNFVNTAEVVIDEPTLPEKAYAYKWGDLRDSHVIKRLFTQDQYKHQKKLHRFRLKLDEYKSKVSEYDKLRRRQAYRYSRLKPTIPVELLPEYNEFFE